MTQEEIKFYRDIYKIFSDEKIVEFLAKYCQIQYNKELKKLRTKQEPYETGYANGALDAYQHMIDLKDRLIAIMRNIA